VLGQQSPNWSARRINRLAVALGARTYLEVGVSGGSTFSQVVVPTRTGVDPKFLFDKSEVVDAHTTLFEGTSDDYFRQLPATDVFDLVFLDGLHTFDQTYRDLCNVLCHVHDRSVILIDDTLPSDVYSSIPDAGKAVKYRARFGDNSKAWHGDTYKVVFAIHEYHLALSYRTIIGSGNPQTLVWRQPDRQRRPALKSMEAVTRLSYFDLLDSMQVLKQSAEEDAVATCVQDLNRVGTR
jgi:hypothetical protein